MNTDELKTILEQHKLWLEDEGGARANLRYANLRCADLDYSCFPLWCGSEGIKLDRRLFLQLLTHICAVEVDDEECKKTQEDLMQLAKQSHVAKWLFAEWKEREEMEHKPDPLEGVQFVSLSNAEIAAMTPEHPLYKLLKGASVLVEGRLKPGDGGNPRVFQRKDGTWGASYEVTADNIQFVGNKKSEQLTDEDVPF